VLRGKQRLAVLAYQGRRESLARALDEGSRGNGLLINLELGLDGAMAGLLAGIAKSHGLDGAWISGPGFEPVASYGRGAAPSLAPDAKLSGEETTFGI
jgi:hypothetical protein